MSFLSIGIKKILLISVIVILSLIELLFFVAGVAAVITEQDDQPLQTAVTYLFVLILFGFALWWAIRRLNELKRSITLAHQTSTLTNHHDADAAVIRLQSKVELPEYRKLMYHLTFTTPAIIYIYFIGITIVTLSALQGDFNNWFGYFFAIFLLYLPISVYISSRSNYKSTKAIHEPIAYEITPTTISSTGATFTTTITWDSLYKTKEFKDWILLYTNKQVAMFIPKQAFASNDELTLFKSYCARVK